jgi:hypothetical protein
MIVTVPARAFRTAATMAPVAAVVVAIPIPPAAAPSAAVFTAMANLNVIPHHLALDAGDRRNGNGLR